MYISSLITSFTEWSKNQGANSIENYSLSTVQRSKFGPMWLTVQQFFLPYFNSTLAFADNCTGWNSHCLLAARRQILHKYLFSQNAFFITGCTPDWWALN